MAATARELVQLTLFPLTARWWYLMPCVVMKSLYSTGSLSRRFIMVFTPTFNRNGYACGGGNAHLHAGQGSIVRGEVCEAKTRALAQTRSIVNREHLYEFLRLRQG